jgi:hypothetical protein
MPNGKSTVNVKIDMDVKETAAALFAAIKRKGIPTITLPADENGHAYIDKEKHPDLYKWAVEG